MNELTWEVPEREVDMDFVMCPATYGSYRYAQILRWGDGYFLGKAINDMANQDLAALRAEEIIKREGTVNVERGHYLCGDRDGEQAQEASVQSEADDAG